MTTHAKHLDAVQREGLKRKKERDHTLKDALENIIRHKGGGDLPLNVALELAQHLQDRGRLLGDKNATDENGSII